MVAHLMAAGVMAATALGAAQDFDADDPNGDEQSDSRVPNVNRPGSGDLHHDDPEADGEERDSGKNPKIRSVTQRSERFPKDSLSFAYRRPDGGILLQTPQPSGLNADDAAAPSGRDDDDDGEAISPCAAPLPLPYGFLGGNFGAGTICEVKVPEQSSCYAVAFHPTDALLAIGRREGLAIHETSSYSLVHTIELEDMVSAISWVPLPEPHNKSQNCLLVVGTLDGLVALYSVDVNILECHGPNLLYQHRVPGQVRALSACLVSTRDDASAVLIGVGTKTGTVKLVTVPVASMKTSTQLIDPKHVSTRVVAREATAILGMDVHAESQWIAWGTKTGHVVVHKLGPERDDGEGLALDGLLWCTHRQGPVRTVMFAKRQGQLIFGGYDKTVVVVDTQLWAISRQLSLKGTVNTVSMDPLGRYLTVGTRDKMFQVFDTSTFVNIKSYHTPGWVTSISWMPNGAGASDFVPNQADVVAVRTTNTTVSILNLSPILVDETRLSASTQPSGPDTGLERAYSMSWTCNGRFLARCLGSTVRVSDVLDGHKDVCEIELSATVMRVAFCPVNGPMTSMLLAVLDTSGILTMCRLAIESSSIAHLEVQGSTRIEPHLKALKWSHDGSYVVTGGRGGKLHFICASKVKPTRAPVDVGSRIWDIDVAKGRHGSKKHRWAVALGDYTAVVLDESFEPSLRIERSRTVRCVSFHPSQSLIAVGDGDGVVSVVDMVAEEVVSESSVHGRVNVVEFSPIGDYLIVGTDDCVFEILETATFQTLQKVYMNGFAVDAAFSPVGSHLVLGSVLENYSLLRLGPFLGIDLVPIEKEGDVENLPEWALKEVLFRSGRGPSLVQRHMIRGGHETLARVADLLRQNPDAMHAFNRQTGEGCFDTALALKRPNLLRMAVVMLVDGTLDNGQGGQKSLLTTSIPWRGRRTLLDFVENHPPDFIVSILKSMTFSKVPFTRPHLVEMHNHRRFECGNSSFVDPWPEVLGESHSSRREKRACLGRESTRGQISLTPAVLPLPGLGDLEFLSCLLLNAPPSAFDNDSMALVLGVMWRDNVRRYFVIDCLLFVAYYTCWVVLLELMFQSNAYALSTGQPSVSILALVVVGLNSLFLSKETIQSGFFTRKTYFFSLWNWVDLSSILCIYIFVLATFVADTGVEMIPLGVVTTLLLTVKFLSYLRGFSDTGWLISVLIANFRDVRGFLLILFSILFGFAVTFRLLFGGTGEEAFDSLRRSFLSTFEITILGTYDASLLYNDVQFRPLATVTFILAVTCVLVVALNALISILGDSYARVQEHSTANRRNERAALIVEYLTLLPTWYRNRIESRTKWFHVLLEVDADDNLLVKKDDWEGGLNAVRRDMQLMEQRLLDREQQAVDRAKTELDNELKEFRKDVLAALTGVSEDLKRLHTLQAEGGITLSGKNVAKAVRAVKSIRRRGGVAFGGDS